MTALFLPAQTGVYVCVAGCGVATLRCVALRHIVLCCVVLRCDSQQFEREHGSYHAASVFLLSLCFCEDLAAPSGNHQEILL